MSYGEDRFQAHRWASDLKRVDRSPVRVRFQDKESLLLMTKDDFQLLYEYDRWANNRVLQSVSRLSTEQFARDLGGSFRSVRDTVVHIIAAQWSWLTYWTAPSQTAAFLEDLWVQADALFHANAFPNFEAVRLKWAEVEKMQLEFVNSVTEEALRKILPVRASNLSLAHSMQHVINHSTYHRGQVVVMLRQLAAEPLPTDFAFFLLTRFSPSQ
jgi:uncharacterized damage-inducible protein DinB